MNKFNFSLKIFEGIVGLIHLAEALHSDTPKTGVQKKQEVMEGMKEVITSVEGFTTGGAKGTWKKLEPVLPGVIDSTVGIIFPPKETKL